MKELFEEIAKAENCLVNIEYETAYTPFVMSVFTRIEDGVQIKSLSLDIPYRDHKIEVRYSLSNDQSAIIKCNISLGHTLSTFRISNRSHYLRLFNRRLDILKIDCKDEKFGICIREKLQDTGLEQLARKTQFEPSIEGEMNENAYMLVTSYYLGFSEKEEVLSMIIEFYKLVIDMAIDSVDK